MMVMLPDEVVCLVITTPYCNMAAARGGADQRLQINLLHMEQTQSFLNEL